MKDMEDIPSCDIELFSETLAVVLSDCRRHRPGNDQTGSSSHRSGKNLFRAFVKENSSSVWKPSLVESITSVRFIGFFRDPPTLLLQTDSTKLQHIREAWSNRLLRAPPRFHIDFVGDVTSIGARPLSRGKFIPLCDAICISIGNVASQHEIATQEVILEELNRAFPAVHSPSRELLHETLGKLIRERKVFCTGPGYHLVTESTYSGKVKEEKWDESQSATNEIPECQACQRNRAAFSSRVAERRSFRIKKGKGVKQRLEEDDSITFTKKQFCTETLHGSVVQSEEAVRNSRSPRKSMAHGNEAKKSNNGFVEKVASKIFRRRNKSGSERRVPKTSRQISPDPNKTEHENGQITEQVRELSPNSARRLGYVMTSYDQESKDYITTGNRSSSESPVKHVSNDEIAKSSRRRSRKTERQRLQVSNSENHPGSFKSTAHSVGTQIKDQSPIKHTSGNYSSLTISRSKSPVLEYHQDPVARLRETSKLYQNPRVRDVAVSCNLEGEETVKRRQDKKSQRSSRRMTSAEELGHKTVNPSEGHRSLRRSKSLRLPRERQCDTYVNSSLEEPPEFQGFHFTDTRESLINSSSGHSATLQRKRQSLSSASSGREYSYLHACHFAPSIRVGSVIADHLEELERRRLLVKERSYRASSSASSTLSSQTSNQTTSTPSWDNNGDDVMYEEEKDEAANERIDAETAAALEIAKRLAKLDIKMTRQEWTDYFSNKILPSHVEQSLLESEEKTEESSTFESPTSFFENTSGSVETVIDLNHEIPRNSNSSTENKESTIMGRQLGSSQSFEQRRRSGGDDVFFQLKGTTLENASLKKKCAYESGTRFSQFTSPYLGDHSEQGLKYDKPIDNKLNYNFEDESESGLHLAPHTYLTYCRKHRQMLTTANDTASLTEDSGFHSSRERNSLSSWDASKKTSETFV